MILVSNRKGFLNRSFNTILKISSDHGLTKIKTDTKTLECDLYGSRVLNSSFYNKGSAFTERERKDFGLEGLLPVKINTLDQQVERAYKQFSYLNSFKAKSDFCTSMRLQNKVLYFNLVSRYVREMLPIIYTPTEGEAIQTYSQRFRKPEGCFLDVKDPESIDRRLLIFGSGKDIDYITVSDGEGILGIGDQGVGGVRISIAKLDLMTLFAGIDPRKGLPIFIDFGTNNQKLLNDNLYMGNKFPRVDDETYWSFFNKFIKVVKKRFPYAVLHYEDFGIRKARSILNKYRTYLPSFNDDIQGTGAVVMASFLSALKFSNKNLIDSQVLIFGAGTAGLGIADQIYNYMLIQGSTPQKAKDSIHLMDRDGIILDSHKISFETQKFFSDKTEDWVGINTKNLTEAVRKIKPTILIGCSTKPGAFTEDAVKEMYKHNSQPIIFPLSNPTHLHEADPRDLMKWTNNNALIATGSPFEPVDGYEISENNNCFTFPGIGLGAVLSKCKVISNTMITAAIETLASLSPKTEHLKKGLLPDISEIKDATSKIATAFILQVLKEETLNDIKDPEIYNLRKNISSNFEECHEWVKSQMWVPEYNSLIKVSTPSNSKHTYH